MKSNPTGHEPMPLGAGSVRASLGTGRLRKELGGAELFLAIERMSEEQTPRDVRGTIELEPVNGPHGFRAVYFLGRQIDDAKVWTSAMFVTFGG